MDEGHTGTLLWLPCCKHLDIGKAGHIDLVREGNDEPQAILRVIQYHVLI